MELEQLAATTNRIREQIHRVVVGQDPAIDLLLIALVAEGHVLIEGVPGTAKTLLARCFAATLNLSFNRIQFTPDLMPGDVIGTNLFDFQTNRFTLTKGPIFTQILLADEINRTPPKTQAALLQAMQERTVTIDGRTYPLEPPFLVVATQNPIEQQGTYPLPEAQLDRFLFKILIEYPERDEEREIVGRHGRGMATPSIAEYGIETVGDADLCRDAREVISEIHLSPDLVDYVVDLVRATREHPALLYGSSPRSANMLAVASRARAALQGRGYVIPDDIKTLAPPVLQHRLLLAPTAELEGTTVAGVVAQILEQVPAPR